MRMLLLLVACLLLSASAITYNTDYDLYDSPDVYSDQDTYNEDGVNDYDDDAGYGDDSDNSYDTTFSDDSIDDYDQYGSTYDQEDGYGADTHDEPSGYEYTDYEPISQDYAESESDSYGLQEYEPADYQDQYYDETDYGYYDDDDDTSKYTYTDYEPESYDNMGPVVDYGYTDYQAGLYEPTIYQPQDKYDFANYQLTEHGSNGYHTRQRVDTKYHDRKHRHLYNGPHGGFGKQYAYPDLTYSPNGYADYYDMYDHLKHDDITIDMYDQYGVTSKPHAQNYHDVYNPHYNIHGSHNYDHNAIPVPYADKPKPYIHDYYGLYDSHVDSQKMGYDSQYTGGHKHSMDGYSHAYDSFPEKYDSYNPHLNQYTDHAYQEYDKLPAIDYGHHDYFDGNGKLVEPHKTIRHDQYHVHRKVHPKKQQPHQLHHYKNQKQSHKRSTSKYDRYGKDQSLLGYVDKEGAKNTWIRKYQPYYKFRYPNIGMKSNTGKSFGYDNQFFEDKGEEKTKKYNPHREILKVYPDIKQGGYELGLDSGYDAGDWYHDLDSDVSKYDKGVKHPNKYNYPEKYAVHDKKNAYKHENFDKSIEYDTHGKKPDYDHHDWAPNNYDKGFKLPDNYGDLENYNLYDHKYDNFGKSAGDEDYDKKREYREAPSYGHHDEGDYDKDNDLSLKSQDELDSELLKDASYRLKSGLKGQGKFVGIGTQELGTKFEQVTSFHHGGSIDKHGKRKTHYGGYDTKGSVKNYGEEHTKKQHMLHGTLKAVGMGDDYDNTRAKGKFTEKLRRYEEKESEYGRDRDEKRRRHHGRRKSRDSRIGRKDSYDKY